MYMLSVIPRWYITLTTRYVLIIFVWFCWNTILYTDMCELPRYGCSLLCLLPMRSGLCCPACRTTLIATRFWVVMICRIIKCLTVLEFSFILFHLCLFITIFNFILNYVPIVTFWIFTYHKIWILLIIFFFYMKLLNYLFFNMFGGVLECCELTGVSFLWPWLIKWK